MEVDLIKSLLEVLRSLAELSGPRAQRLLDRIVRTVDRFANRKSTRWAARTLRAGVLTMVRAWGIIVALLGLFASCS